MKLFPGPWFRVVTTIFQNPLALVAGILLCLSPVAARGQSVSFAGAQSVLPSNGLQGFGVAVDNAGDVFVFYLSQDVVEFPRTAAGYGPPTTLPLTGLSESAFFEGIAVDGAGDVFVTSIDDGAFNGRVLELPTTPTGYGPQMTLPFNDLTGPVGIAVDRAGDVFICDQLRKLVFELPKTETGYGLQTTLPFTGLEAPNGVALDGAGDLFVNDIISHLVLESLKTSTGYGPSTSLFPGLLSTYGIAADNAGNLFVTTDVVVDSGGVESVLELPQTATGYGPQIKLPFNAATPIAVAVDSTGNVYVSDPNAGGPRILELQTVSVNFDGANVCAPGATTPAPCSQTLTLTYNVNADTTLGEPQVSTGGVKHLDFNRASGSTCIGAVTAGTTCTVNVTFSPLAAGFRHGSVGLPSGGHDLTTTQLSGFGIEATTGAPVAQLSTSKRSFGAIDFGITQTFPLFVANIGGGTLTVAPSISGPSYKIADSTCAAGVTAGNSCTLVVEYTPVSIGPHDDTLTVATNGGSPTVGLEGSVVGLSVLGGVSGATLEFGTVSSGSTEALPLTVTNVGLPGTVMVETGISGLSFSVLTEGNTCLAGIAAGHSCTLPVQFAPTHSGLHDELLTLTPFPGAGSTTVWLTGSTP